MSELKYYFDFLSPYSFFAWQWIGDFCDEHDLELRAEPIVLGVVLSHWGHKGPAEIPAKRAFAFRDCLRTASAMGLEFQMPKFHPFNPLPSLRVALPQVGGDDQHAIIGAIWSAGWQQGADLGDPKVLAGILDAAGFDGARLMEQTRDPQVKEALKQTTAAAVEAGVFGVPTFVVDGELFWGNDQQEALRRWVEEGDPGYLADDLERLLDREATVRRS